VILVLELLLSLPGKPAFDCQVYFGSDGSVRNIAIIAASVGGAAVLLAICLTIFFIRDRRRYQRQLTQIDKSVSSRTDSHNEKGTFPQMILLGNTSPSEYATTPVDTFDLPSEKGYYDKISLASWSQPAEDRYSPPLSEAKQSLRRPATHLSPNSSTVPQRTLLQSPTINRSLSGRHLRAPSDVPADLNSRCSTVSSESYYPSMFERETKVPPLAVIAPSLGPRGLPASPRDAYKGSVSRSTSRSTSRAPSRANSNRSIT
jgi:hypothetical protein